MLTAGLRKSEVCQLRTDSVNLVDREMIVVGKGDKEALLHLQPVTVSYMQAWFDRKGCHTEYVFTPISRAGGIIDRPLSDSGVSHVLRAAADAAEIPTFAPHDMRRTFATSLFSAGLDAHKIRELMRHSRLETTQLYNLRDQNELKNALESVDIIG